MTKINSNSDRDHPNREGIAGLAGESGAAAWSKASELASDATKNVGEIANEGWSALRSKVNEALDQKVTTSADVVSQIAQSVRRVASDLEANAPQVAGVVEGLADSVQGYSQDLRHQSAEQLFRSASSFTKKQPALVFGLAALAGFFAHRTFSAASAAAPSIQPFEQGQREPRRYGA